MLKLSKPCVPLPLFLLRHWLLFCSCVLFLIFFAVQPFSWRAHLVVGVDEGASRHIVGVHGHRLLLGSQVLTLVQWQWDHWALVIQTAFPGKRKKNKKTNKTCGEARVSPMQIGTPGAYCVDWTVGKVERSVQSSEPAGCNVLLQQTWCREHRIKPQCVRHRGTAKVHFCFDCAIVWLDCGFSSFIQTHSDPPSPIISTTCTFDKHTLQKL